METVEQVIGPKKKSLSTSLMKQWISWSVLIFLVTAIGLFFQNGIAFVSLYACAILFRRGWEVLTWRRDSLSREIAFFCALAGFSTGLGVLLALSFMFQIHSLALSENFLMAGGVISVFLGFRCMKVLEGKVFHSTLFQEWKRRKFLYFTFLSAFFPLFAIFI